MRQRAVERQLEIIGEAANRVTPQFRAAHPLIAWKAIIAQRNVLAHEYGAIAQERIWEVAQRYIPELIRQIEDSIPPLPDDDR